MKKLQILALLSFLSILSTALINRNDTYKVYPTEEKIIYDISFSANGSALLVADGNKVRWFSTEDQKLLSTFNDGHKNTILSLNLSKDSTLLASGGKDSTIVIWDVMNKGIIKRLSYHKGIISSVHLSPDNQYLFSGGTDNKVHIYDLKSDKLVNTFLGHTDDVTSMDVSADGKYLVSASADGTINFYDIKLKKEVASITDRKSWVREVSFNKEGDRIISCGDNGWITTWNIANIYNISKISERKINANRLHSVNFYNNNQSQSYVTGGLNGKINVVIVKDIYEYKTKINKPINKLLFNPGQKNRFNIAVATRGGGVLQIDAKDMKLMVYGDSD